MENKKDAQKQNMTVRERRLSSDPYINPYVSAKLDPPLEMTDTKEGWKKRAMMHLEDYKREEAVTARMTARAAYYEALAKKRAEEIKTLNIELSQCRERLEQRGKVKRKLRENWRKDGYKPSPKEAMESAYITREFMSDVTGIKSKDLERYISGETKWPEREKCIVAGCLGYGTEELTW